ncbi:cytochrome P450 [Armillaria mellea]|nr:cytochrome P450 [Armillaria mellea]
MFRVSVITGMFKAILNSLSVANYAILASTLLILARYLYQYLNHPLRHYPGPRIAALSKWYKFYFDVLQDGGFLEHLEKLHIQYGPVVRVGPNEVHFSNPRAYGDIYFVGSKFTKDPELYDAFDQSSSSFACVDPHAAKIRRELLGPVFSRSRIIKIQSVIQEKVDHLIRRLTSGDPENPVNLFLAFRAATMDIIMLYCFAESFESLDADKFEHPILLSVISSVPMIWPLKYFPWLIPMVAHGPQWLIKHLLPAMKGYFDLFALFSNRIDRAIASPESLYLEDHETVFHCLLSGKGDAPSKRSLLEESITLLGAGSETVGAVVTAGVYHVLSNLRSRERLMQELNNAWPSLDMTVKYQDLEKLPYLTAVIKESIRLSHGVVTPLPRVVGPSDSIICGHPIPAGTTVSIGITFVHANPDVFHDPDQFIPERWFVDDIKEIEAKYFVPFSKGPRMCLGHNLAWCELYLLFANIFRKTGYPSEDFAFRQYWIPVFRGKQMHGFVTQKSE